MTRRPLHTTAIAGALALLLTACTPNDNPTPGGTHTSTGSPTPSVSEPASPTSTLTPVEQEAFDQATAVVVAYQQTLVDLYTGARTDVNDLNSVVATGDLLDASLKNVSQGLSQGYRADPAAAQIVLVSAEPVRISPDKDPVTVVVRACIDQTSVTIIEPDGSSNPGLRDELDYTVVKTDYLPEPGWAVESMTGDPEPEDRAC